MENYTVCRLCAFEKETTFGIFDEEGCRHSLAIKLQTYLNINVNEKDSLPLRICWECYSKLEECCNFIQSCQDVQITLNTFSYYKSQHFPTEQNVDQSSAALYYQHIPEQNEVNINYVVTTDFNINGGVTTDFNINGGVTTDFNINGGVTTDFNINGGVTTDFNINGGVNTDFNINGGFNTDFNINGGVTTEFNEETQLPNAYFKQDVQEIDSELYNKEKEEYLYEEIIANEIVANEIVGSQSNPKSSDSLYKKESQDCNEASNRSTLESKDDLYDGNQETDKRLRNKRQKRAKKFNLTKVKETIYDKQTKNLRIRSRKKKSGSVKNTKCEDFDQLESELFKQKYFNNISWLCAECESKYETLADLRQHYVLYHSSVPRFMCPFCYKVYCRYFKFILHIKNHPDKGNIKCEICDRKFPIKSRLKEHMASHLDLRKFVCKECGKAFRQSCTLFNHSKIHLPNHVKFKFHCQLCNKKFVTKPSLRIHQKTHTNERNFTCHQCGKGFVQKVNLRNHIVFVHTSLKLYTCKTCNKEFKTATSLHKHEKVHSDIKPYQCETCGKTFRQHVTLMEHSRIHTGITPFTCNDCGKSFKFSSGFRIHRRQHTGERPYNCSKCSHSFCNWHNYNKHMSKKHDINIKKDANLSIKEDMNKQNDDLLDGTTACVNEDALQSTLDMPEMYYFPDNNQISEEDINYLTLPVPNYQQQEQQLNSYEYPYTISDPVQLDFNFT